MFMISSISFVFLITTFIQTLLYIYTQIRIYLLITINSLSLLLNLTHLFKIQQQQAIQSLFPYSFK